MYTVTLFTMYTMHFRHTTVQLIDSYHFNIHIHDFHILYGLHLYETNTKVHRKYIIERSGLSLV